MTDERTQLLREIDDLYRRMVRKFVKERDKIVVEGVTLPGLMILNKIVRDGDQKLSDLAEQLDFTSGAITAICDKLEKQGFAIRHRLKTDRRTVLLSITDSGREMLFRQRNIGPGGIQLLFGEFDEEELRDQGQLYRKLIANLDGFAERILALVEANETRSPSIEAEAKPSDADEPNDRNDPTPSGRGCYLSY